MNSIYSHDPLKSNHFCTQNKYDKEFLTILYPHRTNIILTFPSFLFSFNPFFLLSFLFFLWYKTQISLKHGSPQASQGAGAMGLYHHEQVQEYHWWYIFLSTVQEIKRQCFCLKYRLIDKSVFIKNCFQNSKVNLFQ